MVNYQEIIDRIDLSIFPVRLELKLVWSAKQSLWITMYGVKDRDKGTPLDRVEYKTSLIATDDREEALQFVYWNIQEFILHELAECFKVSGKRFYDPHEGKKGGDINRIMPKPKEEWCQEMQVSGREALKMILVSEFVSLLPLS